MHKIVIEIMQISSLNIKVQPSLVKHLKSFPLQSYFQFSYCGQWSIHVTSIYPMRSGNYCGNQPTILLLRCSWNCANFVSTDFVEQLWCSNKWKAQLMNEHNLEQNKMLMNSFISTIFVFLYIIFFYKYNSAIEILHFISYLHF